MALNFKLINLKRVITKSRYNKEDKIVTDLSEPTLKPDYSSPNFKIGRTVEVSKDYEMRPDLISYWAYGVDSYADVILKANGISNPFSIAEGDVILIPDLEMFNNFYQTPKPSKKEINEIKNSFIDYDRFSKPNEERIKKLKMLANSKRNGSPTITPSNKLKPGENSINTRGGALIFAEYKSK